MNGLKAHDLLENGTKKSDSAVAGRRQKSPLMPKLLLALV